MTNYEKAVTLWKGKKLESDAELAEALIKEFQMCLTQNTYGTCRWQLGERPGEYRRHDYVTGRLEIGAAPEDVQEEMAELLGELPGIRPSSSMRRTARDIMGRWRRGMNGRSWSP